MFPDLMNTITTKVQKLHERHAGSTKTHQNTPKNNHSHPKTARDYIEATIL